MISYLKELMEQGEYHKALQVAMEALLQVGNDLHEFVEVNLLVAECRLKLNEPLAALPSAQIASKLARDLESYDALATAELFKGKAYANMRQYVEAMDSCFTVIEFGPRLQGRKRLEYDTWMCLGFIYERVGDAKQQIWALRNAWKLNFVTRNSVERNSLRTMLLHASLSAKDYDSARDLLRDWRNYLGQNPEDTHGRYLYVVDLARFALERKKYRVTSHLALEELDRQKGHPIRQGVFYQYLYEASIGLDRPEEALGYALAARMAALEARRYDIEFEAAEWVVELVRKYGSGLVAKLDKRYMAQGVNLGSFLGQQTWRS